MIEAIGIGTPKNMSSIAKKLSVTVGTLTIAMNSLVKKGYVKRERGEEDRRVVYISLSDKGKKAFVHHARFHKEMITSIMDEFDDDEKKILIRGLTKLDNWFKNKEEENKKESRVETIDYQLVIRCVKGRCSSKDICLFEYAPMGALTVKVPNTPR